MDKFSFLSNIEPGLFEELFNRYKTDPGSVDASWQKFFEGFEFALANYKPEDTETSIPAEFKVINLILAYRQRGHLFTKTNPVRVRRKYSPTLDIENFGLTSNDLKTVFKAGNEIGIGDATLETILSHLKSTYCNSIGTEFMYIRIPEIVQWFKEKMEPGMNIPVFNEVEKLHILDKLSEAVLFEKFIHKKFPGQKSFSLEGCESLIPALDALIETGSETDTEEFIIGMAHRGRLNVLANIMHKPYETIFSEFEGKEYSEEYLLGDVKYHLGYSSETQNRKGKNIKLSLVPNPSHLEAVDPVAEGIVRAKIDTDYKNDNSKIIPVLIHGDASVAGQGIVYEVLQMSQLDGYKTGGTIHIVINNQIGFTTNYLDARSSIYCTDVGKTIHAPIIHVNADDVEAVVYSMKLAVEFRQKFKRDIFIDMLGYRKYGHNESDEPRYTQPILYKIIEKHPNPEQIYIQKLIEEGIITKEKETLIESNLNKLFEAKLDEAKKISKGGISLFMEKKWKHIRRAEDNDFKNSPETGVSEPTLIELSEKITALPQGKNFFRKISKLLEDRKQMIATLKTVDWAMAEHLAFASLLNEGISVRLSGQDVERGTFSHRHAVLKMEDSEEEYIPLLNTIKGSARFDIYNSLLSEYGVLGFEYGYAMTLPDALTIWEAQFGDFNNGAQIIIDQYLTSAEDKWKVMNGLVMLLPHSYEGQGPEHSSARIERFLVLCAENNIQVVNCSTPASFFHVLRRQIHREFRKPLIVFTPKSLLRHPKCISSLDDLSTGKFNEIIDDSATNPEQITKLVFCSGKIYYELLEERTTKNISNTVIIRIEQLYPFPIEQYNAIIAKYTKATDHLWVQEEPENMGAWSFLLRLFKEKKFRLIARPPSGSPATGSSKYHIMQQRKIIEKTFEECDCERVCMECKIICIDKPDTL
jgi:2-oxoglutarate dehydrogenase E1 component